MKAVINENKTPVKSKYPYLGRVTNKEDDSCVVFFISPKEGIVVQSTNVITWKIGEYDDCWTEIDFTHFTGSITLSND